MTTKGQVTIPKSILKQAGIDEDAPLLIAARPDGSIVLRQAGVYPIELYTDERVAEFERENAVPETLAKRVDRLVRRRSKICREASGEEVRWARSTGLADKDVPILAAAVGAKVDLLVTGDRTDFGSLYGKKLRGVAILSPRSALERILANSK